MKFKLVEKIDSGLETESTITVLTEAKTDEQSLIEFAGEDLAHRFINIKNRLIGKEKDLYYWIKNKTPEELEQKVSEVESRISKSQMKRDASKAAKLIGENESWKVYEISSFQAAQQYGRDTEWCISGIGLTGQNNAGDIYWKEYQEQGAKIYFYIAKSNYNARGNSSKYAVVVYPDNTYEVFNQQDERVNNIENAPDITGLPRLSQQVSELYKHNGENKMKFKLVENLDDILEEDILNETLYRDIVNALSIKTKGRGETSLRTFICGLLQLNPSDYVLHHIDGHHDNNLPDNLALISKASEHNTLHCFVSRAVERDDTLRKMFQQYQQGEYESDDTLIPQIVEALISHFRMMIDETPGVIIVLDALKKRGLNI